MPEETNPAPKARILCTEDDVDTLEVLRMLLELEGFEVTCAEDSAQALRWATAERFDLYLLDHWMPEMAGDLLCQKLREFDYCAFANSWQRLSLEMVTPKSQKSRS